ncbi:MAG: hypothetical protein II620_00880, partial [Paludibacteraceae bacterium]|nr:hypothetical protein [Paludibacteraceae bacterium]
DTATVNVERSPGCHDNVQTIVPMPYYRCLKSSVTDDGDARSSYNRDRWKEVVDPDLATKRLYDADEPTDPESMLASKISNTTRVYKGGSWKDRAYWLSPAQRRYLEQDKCTNDIGFRCAMHRVGSDKGNNAKKK